MQNPLIKELRDSLAFSESYDKTSRFPDAKSIVMASQESVRATLEALDDKQVLTMDDLPEELKELLSWLNGLDADAQADKLLTGLQKIIRLTPTPTPSRIHRITPEDPHIRFSS